VRRKPSACAFGGSAAQSWYAVAPAPGRQRTSSSIVHRSRYPFAPDVSPAIGGAPEGATDAQGDFGGDFDATRRRHHSGERASMGAWS